MATILDTDQHSTPAAETYTAAQAAAFYTNANGGGIIQFTFTPTLASATYVGGNFHSLFSDRGAHGGLWLDDAKLELYTSPGDALVFSVTLAWSALMAILGKIDSRTASRLLTISGATSGNVTNQAIGTAPNYYDSTQDLGVGSLPGQSGFRFAGVISDVDDAVTTALGSGGFTLDEMRVDGTATAFDNVTGGFALDEMRVDGAATVAGVGSGGFTLDEMRIDGQAALAAAASGGFALDELRVDGSATVYDAGSVTGGFELDEMRVDGSAVTSIAASGGFELDEIRIDGAATIAGVASGGFTLDEMRVTGSAALAATGSGGFALDEMRISGSATAGAAAAKVPTLDTAAVVQRIFLTPPDTGTLSTAAIDADDDEHSLFVIVVMRGVWDGASPAGPSDNAGTPNTYDELELHEYDTTFHPTYAGAKVGVYLSREPVVGSGALVASANWGPGDEFGKGDELTVMIARIRGADGRRPVLVGRSFVERNSATTITGLSVTSTREALFLGIIAGSAGTGQTHVFNWLNGFVRKASASATGNPSASGYIQIDVAEFTDETATGISKTVSAQGENSEGGMIVELAFQLETIEASGGFRLDEMRVDGQATVGANVTGGVTLDEIRVDGQAGVTAAGSGGFALDELRVDGAAVSVIAGSGGFALDELRVTGAATLGSSASGGFALDELRMEGEAVVVAAGGNTAAGVIALDEMRVTGTAFAGGGDGGPGLVGRLHDSAGATLVGSLLESV